MTVTLILDKQYDCFHLFCTCHNLYLDTIPKNIEIWIKNNNHINAKLVTNIDTQWQTTVVAARYGSNWPITTAIILFHGWVYWSALHNSLLMLRRLIYWAMQWWSANCKSLVFFLATLAFCPCIYLHICWQGSELLNGKVFYIRGNCYVLSLFRISVYFEWIQDVCCVDLLYLT